MIVQLTNIVKLTIIVKLECYENSDTNARTQVQALSKYPALVAVVRSHAAGGPVDVSMSSCNKRNRKYIVTKQKYFFLKYSTILAPPKPILIGTVRTSSATREKISSLLLIHNILPHSQQNQIESFEYQHSNTGTQIIKRVSPIQSFCVSSRFSSSLCTYVETHRSEYIDA